MKKSGNLEDEYWSKLVKTGQTGQTDQKTGQDEASTEDDKFWQPGG